MLRLIASNFLGKAPQWYKYTIVCFLLVNPLVFLFSPFLAGWLILLEFIFTLALALRAYPIPAGGFLALQAAIIGLAKPETIYAEIVANLPTLLLLIFMVAGIYYLKDVLSLIFTSLFLKFRKKWQVSLLFCMVTASLSSFLDALTVLAVLIAVIFSFYAIYHRAGNAYASTPKEQADKELDEFRGFLRNLIMHAAVGTALGGTLTLVGEPQNMMIGTKMGWNFFEFFKHCGIVAVPVAMGGFILCPLLEIFRVPGFGYQLSDKIRQLIVNDHERKAQKLTSQNMYQYVVQGIVAVLLIVALGFHVAEVGIVGIAVIVILSTFTGMTHEHDFAEPFNNAMPFATLIVIFFAILAVVHDQHLITPVIQLVLSFEGQTQLIILYIVNGLLSMVSDSVFVASIFLSEMDTAYKAGKFSMDWYQNIAVVINMGTNIPSLGTPNGTAGFLFLLTSALAPVIQLSYFRMLMLMIPYFLVLSSIGGFMVYFFLN